MKINTLLKENPLVAVFSAVFLVLVLFFLLSHERKIGIEINGRKFQVEVAKTENEIEKGLSGRDTLCENCGMLFVFPEKGKRGFWMKGMRFSLDIIWTNEGKVVYIAKDFSYGSTEVISPEIPADKVLELNAGKADELEIKVGDEVKFR